jgi:predicted ester cyclase
LRKARPGKWQKTLGQARPKLTAAAKERQSVPPTPRQLVERFYTVVWNKADEAEARKILSPDFRFRGSLGPELRGPGGFIAYMRTLRVALENFTCSIDDVIATQDRAAARLSFRGTHRGKFFGAEPTGRDISWSGAAFFTVRDGTISELWVLGDIDAIKRQVMPEYPTRSFSV